MGFNTDVPDSLPLALEEHSTALFPRCDAQLFGLFTANICVVVASLSAATRRLSCTGLARSRSFVRQTPACVPPVRAFSTSACAHAKLPEAIVKNHRPPPPSCRSSPPVFTLPFPLPCYPKRRWLSSVRRSMPRRPECFVRASLDRERPWAGAFTPEHRSRLCKDTPPVPQSCAGTHVRAGLNPVRVASARDKRTRSLLFSRLRLLPL